MLPGPAMLYACPHCGKNKPMFSMLSGNTFGGQLWSDGYEWYPMYPRLSFIQKCPHCNRFSFIDQWKNTGKTEEVCGSTGKLDYKDTKKAYKELIMASLYREVAYKIALYFIHTYNDEFKRPRLLKAILENKSPLSVSGNFAFPEEDDRELFLDASQQAIDLSDNTLDSLILKAELHRERGEWIEAFEILHNLYAGDKQWMVDAILYYTCQRDGSLLPLIIDGRKIDYSDKPNFRTISLPEDPEVISVRIRNFCKFIDSLPLPLKNDIRSDNLGGVYDKNGQTFLKLISPCYKNYDVGGVSHIGDYAFYCNDDIRCVQLPPFISTIGTKAFYGSKNLECVKVHGHIHGSHIQSIGNCAFMNCKSLTSINFIDDVKYLGRSVFAGMDKLKAINLPDQIEVIPEFTFFECESLCNISIPTSVRHIASYSFQHTAITELNLPDSVITLGDAVFSRCFSLETVKLPKHLGIIPERTFDSCKALRELEIHKNVKHIGKEAFADTIALERVRFCGKVESISETAFKGSGLKEIIVPFWTKGHYKKLFPDVKITTKIV